MIHKMGSSLRKHCMCGHPKDCHKKHKSYCKYDKCDCKAYEYNRPKEHSSVPVISQVEKFLGGKK